MEVLDRYLQAVSAWLPSGQRADIVAELGDDLRSEVDDRQHELGRPLTEDEMLALLRRRGHPMWAAEAYLPQRHLIGPAMLPAYWRTVKIVLACLAAIAVILYFVFSGPLRQAVPALSSLWIWVWLYAGVSLAYVGLFTVIFGLVERRHSRARITGEWDPRDPDGLPGPASDPDTQARRRLRANSVADVVSDVLVLAWWLGVRIPAIPELGLVLTPTWHALHWPVALFLAASILVALANALRPSWSPRRLAAGLAVDVAALVLAGVLLSAAPWVRVTNPALPAARLEAWLNGTWLVTLLAITAAYTVRVIQRERQLTERDTLRSRSLRALTGD